MTGKISLPRFRCVWYDDRRSKNYSEDLSETMDERLSTLSQLDQRSRNVFQRLVETYIESGDPVGSRSISRILPTSLSPASIRNVMSDLEALGLIYAPHTSAGRMPTEAGLRLFVDGMLEVGDLTDAEQAHIEAQIAAEQKHRNIEEVLTEATNMLSGLSQCAGVVLTPKANMRLKHIEFVALEPTKAMVILVGEDGSVENRVLDLPPGLPPSTLVEASNYINSKMAGRTIVELQSLIRSEIDLKSVELDTLTQKVVEAGLATWSADEGNAEKSLIVRGRSNLLEDLTELEDLERIRHLFDDLENKRELIRLLGLAESAEGVRIFIGSENKLFSMSGSSLIISPYKDSEQKIVGVLGVIGPTRLNYARIIPMVDYTARVIGRFLT